MERIRMFDKGDLSRVLIFDVETANEKNIGSICAVGWMLLYNDQVVDEGYSLINPHCPFSGVCTQVHGITSRDVVDAPCFAEYWESTLHTLMTGSLVVAHSANFDLSAIEQALYTAGITDPGINYIDSLPVLKALVDAPSYKLTELAASIHFEYNAHNAGEDVHALYEVLCYIRDLCGFEDLKEMFMRSAARVENTQTNNYIPHDIQNVQPRIPVRTHCAEEVKPKDNCFCGMKFCITGDFPNYERADVEYMILEHGGKPMTGVSGKTDYLIVGTYLDPLTGMPTVTSKHRKALELIDQGGKIQILSLDGFMEIVRQNALPNN